MVRRLILVLVAAVATLAAGPCAVPALAFDGQRPGLMLGGGVGVAGDFIRQDFYGLTLDGFIEPGLAADLRAGWGISDAIFLYATARATWIRYDTQAQLDGDAAHGVLGMGMTQFFDRGRSPWYSTGYLGLAWFDLLDVSDSDTLTGFGFGGGVGYALREHLGVECVIGWETVTAEIGSGEFGTTITSLRVRVVGMAY